MALSGTGPAAASQRTDERRGAAATRAEGETPPETAKGNGENAQHAVQTEPEAEPGDRARDGARTHPAGRQHGRHASDRGAKSFKPC